MLNYLGSEMVSETKKARFLPPVWLECIIFFGVFLAANVGQLVIMLMGIVPVAFGMVTMPNGMDESVLAPVMMLIMLLATVGTVVAVFIYCRAIQKRNAVSTGLRKKHIGRNYAIGLGFGALEFVICFGAMAAFGLISDFRLNPGANWFVIALFFVCFLIQTFSEEYLCRGYLMNSVSARSNIPLGIIVISLIFGLLHALNPGITLFALIVLALTGVSMSLVAMLTDDIWAASGMHFFWNFSITCLLGDGLAGADYISVFTVSTKDTLLIDAGFFSLDMSTLFQFIATLILVAIPLALLLVRNARNKQRGIAPHERYVSPKKRAAVYAAPGYYAQPAAGYYAYPPAAFAPANPYAAPQAQYPAGYYYVPGYAPPYAPAAPPQPATYSPPYPQQTPYAPPMQQTPYTPQQQLPVYAPPAQPPAYHYGAPTQPQAPGYIYTQQQPFTAQTPIVPPTSAPEQQLQPAPYQAPLAAPAPQESVGQPLAQATESLAPRVATDEFGRPLESRAATPDSCAPPPPQLPETPREETLGERPKTAFPKIKLDE